MGFDLKVKKKPAESSEAQKPNGAAKKSAGGFLKSGAAAKKLMEKHEAEVAARKDKAGKAFRFFIKPGEDANITFLDGRIDPETGILDIKYANEHRCKVEGNWEDFICVEDQEPCPLCEAGERKTFVGYLTILDHREREYEKDGKTVKVDATRRLYVAKTETLKQLTKMAEKRENGLVGVTYEVSRTGDKKAAVGDLFDRIAEHEMSEIEEAFPDIGKPLDYDSELVYHTAEELIALGIGKKVATIGSKSFGKKAKTSDEIDEKDTPW